MNQPHDPIAAAVKEALAPQAEHLPVPAASGLAATVARGRHLRLLRRLRWGAAAAAVLVAATVAVVLTAAPDAAGPDPSAPTTGATASVEPAPSSPAASAPATTAVPTTSTTADEPAASAPAAPVASPPSPSPAAPAGPAPPAPPPAPTTVPPPPATTTTTVAPAPNLELLVSSSPDRTGAVPLDGATLSGVVYVFYDHVAFPPTGPTVTFWVDDPAAAGLPHRVEAVAPYDLEATTPGGQAYGFDLANLGPGPHTVTASAGPGHLVTVGFTVT